MSPTMAVNACDHACDAAQWRRRTDPEFDYAACGAAMIAAVLAVPDAVGGGL